MPAGVPGTADHAEPFHISFCVPTAAQNVELVHDTPIRSEQPQGAAPHCRESTTRLIGGWIHTPPLACIAPVLERSLAREEALAQGSEELGCPLGPAAQIGVTRDSGRRSRYHWSREALYVVAIYAPPARQGPAGARRSLVRRTSGDSTVGGSQP